MIIDVHTHAPRAAEPAAAASRVNALSRPDRTVDWEQGPAAYLSAMQPVDRVICFNIAGDQRPRARGDWREPARSVNDNTANFVRQHRPKYTGFMTLHPYDADALDELERSRTDLGLKGIKFGPNYQHFDPLTAFKKVALAIREAVVRGELQTGDRLPSQRELQEVFGVSKVTVIGALRHLEADGVIAIQVDRHGGAIVLDSARQSLQRALGLLLDMEHVNLTEVKELRDSLEVQIARLAAQRAQPAQIAKLDSVVRRLDSVAQGAALPGPISYLVLDMESHATLAEASGNRLLSAWMEVLRYHLLQNPSPVNAERQVELNQSLHQLLDGGIRPGNPEVAGQAMARHLIDSYRVTMQQGAA